MRICHLNPNIINSMLRFIFSQLLSDGHPNLLPNLILTLCMGFWLVFLIFAISWCGF